jgi:hypothetical protein
MKLVCALNCLNYAKPLFPAPEMELDRKVFASVKKAGKAWNFLIV